MIRTIIEFFLKNHETNKFYTELVLPILPILVGGVLSAVISNYPWQYTGVTLSLCTRTFLGLFCGMLCNISYSRIKIWLIKPMAKWPFGDN